MRIYNYLTYSLFIILLALILFWAYRVVSADRNIAVYEITYTDGSTEHQTIRGKPYLSDGCIKTTTRTSRSVVCGVRSFSVMSKEIEK